MSRYVDENGFPYDDCEADDCGDFAFELPAIARGGLMAEPTIKDLCEQYGLTQATLARRFGIPYRTVQDWYSGRRAAADYLVRMMVRLLQLEEEQKR